MAHPPRTVGGRPKGSPNRATRELKQFLLGVFREALLESPEGRARLVEGIRDGSLEPRVLTTLMAYAFGQPARAVDVTHQGQLTLAQLVSGSALEDAYLEGDEDDFDEDLRDADRPGRRPS
jgi:hypothetical protein